MSLLRATGVSLSLVRSIHTSRPSCKDVLARYAIPPGWPAEVLKARLEHDQQQDADSGRLRDLNSSSKDESRSEVGKRETFGSMATNPAIASIQDMPSPTAMSASTSALQTTSSLKSDTRAGQTVSLQSLRNELDVPTQPVPAMIDPVSDNTSDGRARPDFSVQDRTEPLTVAGVFIPVKPKPPGEEGQSQSQPGLSGKWMMRTAHCSGSFLLHAALLVAHRRLLVTLPCCV